MTTTNMIDNFQGLKIQLHSMTDNILSNKCNYKKLLPVLMSNPTI